MILSVPPQVFFTVFKLYKCYQIGQNVSFLPLLVIMLKLIVLISYEIKFGHFQGPFQQFIACDNRTRSPAFFQTIFKFCTFLPKFLKHFALFPPFLNIFLPFFSAFFLKKSHACTYFLEQALTSKLSQNLYTYVENRLSYPLLRLISCRICFRVLQLFRISYVELQQELL